MEKSEMEKSEENVIYRADQFFSKHPAFPVLSEKLGYFTGMSIRDWFAGQALASSKPLPFEGADFQGRADLTYKMADAMMIAREK